MKRSRDFLKAYGEFIRDLGEALGYADSWWATWLSSKNRFCSAIAADLESIFKAGKPLGETSLLRHAKDLSFGFSSTLKFAALTWLRMLYARFHLAPRARGCRKRLAGRKVYLIKTFAYESSFRSGGAFHDAYFGRLAEHLRKRGAEVLTVYDPIGFVRGGARACRGLENVLPLHVFLTPFDMVRVASRILGGLLRKFPSRAEFAGVDAREIAKRQYQRDLLCPNGFFTFCVELAFERIAKQFDLSHLLLTAEHNPWERMCILAVQRRNRETRILGYQHAVVPEAAANMFPAENEWAHTPRPHLLLTTGSEPARLLREYGAYGDFPIVPACGLRFDYLNSLRSSAARRLIPKKLLVVLEGVPEAARLVDYVLTQMRDRADWEVTIRTHPALPMRMLRGRLKQDERNFSRVRVSEGRELKNDLENAGVIAYWGSTVALEALKMGIPVIHFDNGSLLSLDPLFACTDHKWTVQASDPLPQLLDSILAMPAGERAALQSKGAAYVDRYFFSVTSEAMDLFL